ncbi:hypothetical protein [Tahibacter amnicola]|uniref:Uncharacterized protein n=1 Tax=Tahibacter amnicola TaxID=2976241 RepID=A0ABY6BGJ5_9GAMM|nr:hypothetical protein [Tahibacter amnicola]UXI68632.1 hypothetical protein N4264_02985 [Tahibacter amnicola]
MRLLGYVCAPSAHEARDGARRLRRFARSTDQRLVECLADLESPRTRGLLRRPAGARLITCLRETGADALLALAPDAVFGVESAAALTPLLPYLDLPACFIEPTPPIRARQPLVMPADSRLRTPVALFGCTIGANGLERDPWTWPLREQLVALHRGLGQDPAAVAATMNRLGLIPEPRPRKWLTDEVRTILACHAALLTGTGGTVCDTAAEYVVTAAHPDASWRPDGWHRPLLPRGVVSVPWH